MTSSHVNPLNIAVLIPCYNEENAIEYVVKGFRNALPEATIYVYDNNSTDRTVEVARLAGAVVRSETRQGKGNVVRRMFSYMDYEPSKDVKKKNETSRTFHNLEFEPWVTRKCRKHKLGFESWLYKLLKRPVFRADDQLDKLVGFDGKLLVDYVGRLDKIQESLDYICEQIGIERKKMPHENQTQKKHYSEFYNERTRDMVAKMCRVDIEYFGFEFEQK